jgi:hypothetical protein
MIGNTTGRFACRLRVASSFIAILNLMIAIAAPAQSRRPEQSVGKFSDRTELQKRAESLAARDRAGLAGRENKPQNGPPVPLFLPVVTLDAGGESPNDVTGPVAVADLNGDGKLDMVMANPCAPVNPPACSGGSLSVFLGNGDGTFQPAVAYSSGAYWATWVVIADVNNDKKLDLVVANTTLAAGTSGPGIVSVLLGNGDGTFQPAVTYDSGELGATSVAVGDLNRDGKPDLVVSNNSTADSGEGSVAVLLGNGDGTFQAAVPYDSGGGGAGSVVVKDVNGDGKLDVIVSDVCTPSGGSCNEGVAGVLLGNGDGTLKPVVKYDSGGYTAVSIALADLNHDGILDLITFNFCNLDCTSGGIGVLLGNGDGTFQPAVTYASGGAGGLPGMVAVADIDGDGKPDIVANTTTPLGFGLMGTLLGNGDGTFQPAVTYDAGGLLGTSVTTADLTGSHRADLIFTECSLTYCGFPADTLIGLMLHVGTVTTATQNVSSLNPSVFGQTVTFTANVTSGSGTPSGTIEFFDNSALLGSGTLANGSASMSLAGLGAGSHPITALYQGSLKYDSSISQPLNQVVSVATTTTSLSSSGNPILVNQHVKYTATVTAPAAGPISGNMIFTDGATQFSAKVVGNRATMTVKYKTNGVHTITAAYSGDSNNAGSTSGSLTEDVQAATATHLITSGSPSMAGQAVTFTATVTSKYGAIPDGERVTFLDGKTVLGSMPLSGSTTALTISTLSVKTHTIKAVYAGDPIFRTSTGRVTQVVKGN